MKQNNSNYYLVINLGLRSIRAILFNAKAETVKKNWYPIQTFIQRDRIEQNPTEWWVMCKKLIHELLDDNDDYRLNLVSITVTASASCLVILNKKGEPILNSFMVSDKRSQSQAAKLLKKKSLSKIFKNPNNLAVPSYMFPKLLWIKENHPKKFAKISYFMSANDYLLYKLTGKIFTDTLNAEKFYYDAKKNKYPTELLKFIGITPSQLPNVTPIGSIIGPLSPTMQNEFAISNRTKVVISTYDAICAFIGSGVSKKGDTCNVCGTVTSVRTMTDKHIKGKFGILSQQCNDYHIVGGSNNIDGGLLEWSKNMFYGDTYPDKYVYTIMQEEAENSSPGSNGLLFLPYIVGERLPFFDSTTRGIFFGLERFHTRKDIMRSIYEASAFMVHDLINHIEKLGVGVKRIHMSGGLTQSNIACRIRADITGKTIYVTEDLETTAKGALFILLVEDKVFKNLRQAAELVKISKVFKPDRRAHEKYKQLFSIFKKIYKTNKPLMLQRQQLLHRYKLTNKHILENL